MNLFNKKILAQQIARYNFPHSEELQKLQSYLSKLQAFIKDEDLNRTQEIKVQGTYLVRVFSDVLGYSVQLDNNDQWTLEQHPKTEVDAQVADGGLGIFSKENKKYIAVIELKDAKTSLDKKQSGRIGKLTPVEQAFQYLNKFDGCKWAIVSNFREIRIYSKLRGQGFYEKFDIVNLNEENEFKRFYYILNKHNLIDDGQKSVIDHLVEDTTAQEENITKKFYEHYKEIRLKVLNHLFEHNPNINRLVLVEKTQKFLDRLIFTMVCEDSSTLLPAHLVKNTYDRAFQSFALSDSDQRVWTEFKGLFQAIDKGNKRVNPPINAYNGGLFKADEILDNLIIKDDVWVEIIKLTQYDFESDLNVNVLGHIFEQSISDLEEIKASVEGESVDKKKSLRKKQGIFYTPEYITKYIVENTVGKYLEENPDKLESIKILDPACGSGAFLNQAHSFLLSQYKIRDEEKQLELQRQGKATGLFDLKWVENDKSILLNNLFGVDLSPESVEITKLALWLKTAKATEPLQNLDNNIKCGNSLIDDPEVAGNRAFNWNNEYKETMDEGGFDVIIGNPPYIRVQRFVNSVSEEIFYNEKYESSTGKYDAYVLFMEQAYKLLNYKGIAGFILPHKFLNTDYGRGIRKFLSEKKCLYKIIDFGTNQVFGDATTYTCVVLITKSQNDNLKFIITEPENLPSISGFTEGSIAYDKLNFNSWNLLDSKKQDILEKISHGKSVLGDLVGGIYQGIVTTGDDIFILSGEIVGNYFVGYSKAIQQEIRIESGIIHPVAKGKDIRRYQKIQSRLFVIYPHVVHEGKTVPIDESKFKTNWPLAYNYLSQFKDELIKRKISYKTNPECWYSLHRARDFNLFTNDKIITPQLQNYPNFTLDDSKTITDAGGYIIPVSKNQNYSAQVLLAILNSRLMWFFIKMTSNAFNSGYYYFKTKYLEPFPLAEITKLESFEVENHVKKVYDLSSKLLLEKTRSLEIIYTKFKINQTSKLEFFYKLGWNEFISELEKQRIILDLTQEDNLNKWFNNVRKELLTIDAELIEIEKQIDQIIYKLYQLDAEEIAIIENE